MTSIGLDLWTLTFWEFKGLFTKPTKVKLFAEGSTATKFHFNSRGYLFCPKGHPCSAPCCSRSRVQAEGEGGGGQSACNTDLSKSVAVSIRNKEHRGARIQRVFLRGSLTQQTQLLSKVFALGISRCCMQSCSRVGPPKVRRCAPSPAHAEQACAFATDMEPPVLLFWALGLYSSKSTKKLYLEGAYFDLNHGSSKGAPATVACCWSMEGLLLKHPPCTYVQRRATQ